MKLTAKVKLLPTADQATGLDATMRQFNAACNAISAWVWDTGTFRQFDIHKGLYYRIRADFGLSAQVVVRAIARVADAYKLDRQVQRTFQPLGAMTYDDRILRWHLARDTVSIWTVAGRQSIPFVCGDYHRRLLATRQGESDLVYSDGTFYLFTTCVVDEPECQEVHEYLGCDLGIKNILTDSDGAVFAGGQLNGLRHRHRRLRAKLQAKGTKSAKRLLKHRRRKEQRFATDTNHTISKHVVKKAQGTERGLALENLQGIRTRVTVRRRQRATLHSWSFAQLRSFVTYKAALAGVPVVLVDPRNTSRTCPACGCIDKANRPSQAVFRCISCGFAGVADIVAAGNIARRAAVNQPHVGVPVPPVHRTTYKLPASVGGC